MHGQGSQPEFTSEISNVCAIDPPTQSYQTIIWFPDPLFLYLFHQVLQFLFTILTCEYRSFFSIAIVIVIIADPFLIKTNVGVGNIIHYRNATLPIGRILLTKNHALELPTVLYS